MSNEFKHKTVGEELTQAEWEATTAHEADGQTANDLLYFNGTTWVRATPASILALLSGQSAAAFSFNSQNVTAVSELRLTPKESSSGPEGTIFYDSVDKCIYVGVE